MGLFDIIFNGIDKFITEGTARSRLKSFASVGMTLKKDSPTYHRMVVLDVIFDPNHITKNIENYVAYYSGMGATNLDFLSVLPRNSIIAMPAGETSTSPVFLIPFFPPNIAFPVKPGEQIWAWFETNEMTSGIGYWICRVNDFLHVDDLNHTHAPRLFDISMMPLAASNKQEPKYEFRNGVVSVDSNNERFTVPETAYISGGDEIFEDLQTLTRSSKIIDYESVPRYRKRPADYSFEGSNNQLIAFTTDRQSSVANYVSNDFSEISIPDSDGRRKAGCIDFVVGRGITEITSGKVVKNSLEKEELGKALSEITQEEGDPDYKNDKARLVLIQRSGSLLDNRMNVAVDAFVQSTKNNNSTIKENEEGINYSAAGVKADKVRIVARTDIVIVSTNSEINENGDVVDIEDVDELSAVVIRPNGDIILKPGKNGVIKLGDETADRAILCTAEAASVTDGNVNRPGPMISTMGGAIGTNTPSQGTYSTKVLVKV